MSGGPEPSPSGGRPAKRSFAIRGHQTSISLEAPFWQALRDAASEQDTTPAALVARIDSARGATGLSSAVRVWLLAYYRARAAGSHAASAESGTEGGTEPSRPMPLSTTAD